MYHLLLKSRQAVWKRPDYGFTGAKVLSRMALNQLYKEIRERLCDDGKESAETVLKSRLEPEYSGGVRNSDFADLLNWEPSTSDDKSMVVIDSAVTSQQANDFPPSTTGATSKKRGRSLTPQGRGDLLKKNCVG